MEHKWRGAIAGAWGAHTCFTGSASRFTGGAGGAPQVHRWRTRDAQLVHTWCARGAQMVQGRGTGVARAVHRWCPVGTKVLHRCCRGDA